MVHLTILELALFPKNYNKSLPVKAQYGFL